MTEIKLKDQIIEVSSETDRYLGFLASMRQLKKADLIAKLIGKSKKKTDDLNKLLHDKSKKELEDHIKGSARLKRTKKTRKKKKEEIQEKETSEEEKETNEEEK